MTQPSLEGSVPRKTYSVRYLHMAGLKGHGHRDKHSRWRRGWGGGVHGVCIHLCI